MITLTCDRCRGDIPLNGLPTQTIVCRDCWDIEYELLEEKFCESQDKLELVEEERDKLEDIVEQLKELLKSVGKGGDVCNK